MLFFILLFAALGLASAGPITKRWSGVQIVSGRTGQCLGVTTNNPWNGSPVYTVDCRDTANWNTKRDIGDQGNSGSITLSGYYNPALALDAGSNPGDFGSLTVWQSFPGLYQQTWFWTSDGRIAITGGDQCLDEGDIGLQTYSCTPGDDNQVWNVNSQGWDA